MGSVIVAAVDPLGAGFVPHARCYRSHAMGPIDRHASPRALLHPLEGRIESGFWADRQRLNRERLLLDGEHWLEEAGNFENLRAAAGRSDAEFRGMVFIDSDVYKWLEALGWELGREPSEDLARRRTRRSSSSRPRRTTTATWTPTTRSPGPARASPTSPGTTSSTAPGTSSRRRSRTPRGARRRAAARRRAPLRRPPRARRSAERDGHAAGTRRSRRRSSSSTGTPASGATSTSPAASSTRRGHAHAAAGHDSARATSRTACRSARPPRSTGHAVRALYLAAGVTDLYLETGEPACWTRCTSSGATCPAARRTSPAGSARITWTRRSATPYELPPDRCYGETCAAIAAFMWSWRMLLATGEARYADSIERTLYNGFLAGWRWTAAATPTSTRCTCATTTATRSSAARGGSRGTRAPAARRT